MHGMDDPVWGVRESEDYTVEVNGESVFCFASWRCDNVNTTDLYHGVPVSPASFAKFSFSGTANVKITPREGLIREFSKLVVRPTNLDIQPSWDGTSLAFTLDSPADLLIDIQGDGMHPLELFTNPPEEDIPDPGDPDVIYFGPGIHDIGKLVLTSNQTLYLHEQAILRPNPPWTGATVVERGEVFHRGEPMISITDANNVTIRGRGIITCSRAVEEGTKSPVIRAVRTNRLVVRDILIKDGNAWTIHVYDSENALIDHVRVLGYQINDDGMCFNGSRDCVARNCYIHVNDDGFEVKAMSSGLVTENILFEDCFAWNDFACSMGVTHEVHGTINNVTWKNIRVLRFDPWVHDNWLLFRGVIFVHAQGGGKVSNLTFQDIHIESTTSNQPVILVDNIKELIEGNNTFPDAPYNRIENIHFRQITGTDLTTPTVVIYDESGKGLIRNITLDDVVLNGILMEKGSPDLKVTNAERIRFIN